MFKIRKSGLCIIEDSLDLWWQILFAFNMPPCGCGNIPRMNADSQVPGGPALQGSWGR